jgi:hypothetical protein
MSQEEMFCRILCLERSLKKANFRIYLLEKKRKLNEEAQKFHELKSTTIQLTMFSEEDELEAIG